MTTSFATLTKRYLLDLPRASRVGQEVAAPVQPRRWFVNPAFDYFFVCGGIVWLFFAIHFIGLEGTDKGAAAKTLLMMSSLGALLLAEVHTAATLVRTYGNKQLRTHHSILSTWVALAFCGLAVVAMFTPVLATSLLKLYLLFVPHHFMSQCYGMVRIYCLKQNYQIDRLEHWALNAVVKTTVVYSMLRQLTFQHWSGTKFLGAEIPFWGPLPEPFLHVSEFALAGAVIVFVFALVRSSLRTDRTFPLAGILTLVTGMAAFTMGQAATGVFWLYVSAFFHATQYLTVIVACKIGECREKDAAKSLRETSISLVARLLQSLPIAKLVKSFPVAKLLIGTVVLSLSIYLGLPKLLQMCGFNYGLALVSIFSTVNLLHFILDSVLWRLRSAELRKLVI